jgi:hypothetical protein
MRLSAGGRSRVSDPQTLLWGGFWGLVQGSATRDYWVFAPLMPGRGPVADPRLVALAATARVPGWLLIAGVVGASAAGYWVACVLWPFAACRRCAGSGKHRSPSGRAWRTCRRCRGTGARLRIGRKIHNYFRGVKDG